MYQSIKNTQKTSEFFGVRRKAVVVKGLGVSFQLRHSSTFYTRKQLLLSARLSHCNSVCLSVKRVDQPKTAQARITKFSLSAAC